MAWLPGCGVVSECGGDHLVALAAKGAARGHILPVGMPYKGTNLWAESGHSVPSRSAVVVYGGSVEVAKMARADWWSTCAGESGNV